MKTTIKTACVIIILLTAGIFSSNAQESIFNTVSENDKVISITECKRNPVGLYENYRFTEYAYNKQGNVVEKRVFKWNSKKSIWIPDHKIVWNENQTDKMFVMEYLSWDKKKNQYEAQKEKAFYLFGESNNQRLLYAMGKG